MQKTIPPGPGMAPTIRASRSKMIPRTNSAHSTKGLSMNRRHCSRVIMRIDVVIHLCSRKRLAGKVHNGLALLRRARGTSVRRFSTARHPSEGWGPHQAVRINLRDLDASLRGMTE